MSFQEVIGHRPLVALLTRSIERGSLPPSLIFAGPEGVGKRLVAIAAAQMLNCAEPVTFGGGRDACGVCASCRRIARGVHPDVILVQPGDSGSIKIEQIRDVIDRAGYRPFEGRRRAVIIDEADAMAGSPQSALLKMLEEPPPSSVFMLITSRPDALLATVLSRCPKLRFGGLDTRELVAVLTRLGRSDAEARVLALLANGSVSRALEASAGDLAGARDLAASVLGHAADASDPRRRLEVAKELATGTAGSAGRDELATELRAMAAVLRDVELLSVNGDPQALANQDAEPTLRRLSAYAGARGLKAFQAVSRALDALDRNASVKIVADWLVLQL